MGVDGAHADWRRRFGRVLHGRDELVEQVLQLIARGEDRLITLVGDGGVGKSHVAAVVTERIASTGRRVVVVDLSGITDAPRALAHCADVIGRRAAGSDPHEWLVETLADDASVLMIDCADLAARRLGAPLAELVDACPSLVVLVTSRLPLRTRGERVVRVGPLPLVDTDAGVDALRSGPSAGAAPPEAAAVAMFVGAASAAGRTVRRGDLPTIGAICNALEGWPLAIELVASHSEVPLSELLDQLGRDGIGATLRNRSSGVAQRHASIVHTVSWSVALLEEPQRLALTTFAMLRSWATLDELIRLWLPLSDGRARVDAFDDVEALLRLHLLVVDDRPDDPRGEPVFRVRPLVRDALGPAPSGRQLAELDRHLVEFADATLVEERSSGPIIWVRALARREADLEAALGRAVERGDANDAGVLADALASIWVRTGRVRDGDRAFRRMSETTWRQPASAGRAAITDAWTLLFRILSTTSQSRRESLARRFDAIVDAAVACGDERSVSTVCELSVEAARRCHHYQSVARHCRIALDLAHDRGELRTAAAHGTWLAMALHVTGDLDASARAGVEALTAARAAESATLAAYASMLLAQLPRDVVAGHGLAPTMAQAVELAELADDPYVLVDILPAAAGAALARGEVAETLASVAAAIDVVRRDALYEQGLPALLVLIALAVIREDDDVAALLGGAVADQLPMLRGVIGARVVDLHLAGLHLARERLGDVVFESRAARGAALTWREVYRTADETAAAWVDQVDRERPGAGLTEREREVLQLLTTGISNKQIARELGITAKTATHHTSSIYRKLGVSTRTEAVNAAFRHGLVRAT